MVVRGGVRNFISQYESRPSVSINWVCFDGGGHEKMPESGYVIENYTRARESGVIKSIVQPLQVSFASTHCCELRRFQKTVDESLRPLKNWIIQPGSTRLIRINHYYTKSKEEYLAKVNVRKWPDLAKGAYREDNWAFPEWQADCTMKEAAAALRANGVPETYGASGFGIPGKSL